MPGTLVKDANGPVLVNATVTATGTGSSVDCGKPANVRIRLTTGTVSGTSPTLDVEIEASDSSTFASGVVSLGKFAQVTASNSTRNLTAYTTKRYLRAKYTVGGTSPSFGSLNIRVEEPHYRREAGDTA